MHPWSKWRLIGWFYSSTACMGRRDQVPSKPDLGLSRLPWLKFARRARNPERRDTRRSTSSGGSWGAPIGADEEQRMMIKAPVWKRGGVSNRSLKGTNLPGNYLSGAPFSGRTLTASQPAAWAPMTSIRSGAVTRSCKLQPWLRAMKAESIRRPREKTFIVYECGISQVLSGENREVRSGFEVSDKNSPPCLPLDFGIVPQRQRLAHSCESERSVGHSTTAGLDLWCPRLL